jgi:uncharacterized protein YecT (DUF1311 family)
VATLASPISAIGAGDASSQPTGPSFDCAKAQTTVEKLVCAEADLAKADRDMAATYRRAVAASRTPADRDRLVRDQVEWLKWRTEACLLDGGKSAALPPPDERGWTTACLGVMYGYRAARLDDIAGLGHVPEPQSDTPLPSLAVAELPGRYAAGGTGWYGTLTLAREGDGLGAAIETVSGPTAHTCNLEGKATVSGRGLVAVAYHDAQRPKADERCTVTLTPIAGGFRIAAQDGDACRYFCGARGNMDGDYYRAAPPRR